MTRLPELQQQIADTSAVPDATQETELDELTRSIPKLIEMLPSILRDRDDPRHHAALAEMISGLVQVLDRSKPLALVRGSRNMISIEKLTLLRFQSQSQVKLAYVDDGAKLRHLHSTAYERFLRTIPVA